MNAAANFVGDRPWLAVGTLCQRELVRFFRQRNRVIGALLQPVLFWLLFGAGFRSSFSVSPGAGGPDFREYFFPGTLAMILLFTAIFATITIIEDRREGFLQSVLVAPAPRWAMVLGKILGGSAIALLQGTAFLLLALTLDVHLSFAAVSATIAFMALIAVALTGLGFLIAWKMDSTAGFHAIMSFVLFPMWLLSGAFFPVPPAGSDSWIEAAMAWLMRLNPLTYGVAGLRRLFYWSSETPLPADLPGLGLSIGVTLAFAAVMLWACWKISAQRISGDLL